MRALFVFVFSGFLAFLSADIPEFMQQYRQRIGGHISELKSFLRDFDQDASRFELSRGAALQLMETKPERFFQGRATTVRGYVERLTRLEGQEELLRYAASPFTVLAFYRDYDQKIYDETLKAYKWGVNAEGIQLGLIVWMLSFLALGAPVLLFGALSRERA